MGELTLFGAAAKSPGFEAAIHMVGPDFRQHYVSPLCRSMSAHPRCVRLRCCGNPQKTISLLSSDIIVLG